MIRASELSRRSVVDLDTAERVGEVDEVVVDPYVPGVAGFVVACDRTLFGSRKRIIVPIDAVHAIGPDAVTIRSTGRPGGRDGHLDVLPRLGELTGRRTVSFGGRLLGAIADALLDERDGRIVGYPLHRVTSGGWLGALFGSSWRFDVPEYVRADSGLRIGPRMIVVPDEAVCTAADLGPTLSRDVSHGLTSELCDQLGPSPAEIRQAQATTTRFPLDVLPPDADDADARDSSDLARIVVATTARDSDDGVAARDGDPDPDAGLTAISSPRRGRGGRRVHAERVR